MFVKRSLLIVILLLSPTVDAWSGGLSKRLQSQITDRIVPAYFRGNSAESLKLLSPLAAKLDEEELTEVDALLSDQGVPDLGALLLDARMKLMMQEGQMLRPHPREASLALPVLQSEIEQVLQDVEELALLEDELPDYATIEEYEQVFWDIHVAANKLRNALRMAEFGEDSIDSALKSNLNQLSDKQLTALDIDFAALAVEIKQTARDLQEAKIELRIRGVTKAAKIIEESKDFRERLRAAYVIDFDGQQVIEFLRKTDRSQFSRPRLREENLLVSMEAYIRLARESAGDLVAKSRLLYLGMHWWTRGRYGLGPDGFGLLKSMASLKSPMAQFPLYMPAKLPTPTDPADSNYAIPKFDRRHHYIWMYEYRTISHNTARKTNTQREETGTRTKLSTFY